MAWSPLPDADGRKKDPRKTLLAVDLGLRAGLALFDEGHDLLWYRSTHFPDRTRMRRAIPKILEACPNLVSILCEGDAGLFALWRQATKRQGLSARRIQAGEWRADLLSRPDLGGLQAKAEATALAHRVIKNASAKNPTSLRHDAAEAICIGLWGVKQIGW
jgi:hypothetical protein